MYWSRRPVGLLVNFDRPGPLQSAPSRIPVDLISHHRPRHDGQFASQGHCGFLLASRLATVNVLVRLLGPLVVTDGAPRTLDQHRSQQPTASFGNPAVAIGLSRLILFRNQAQVAGQLANVLEAMRIVNGRDQCLGGFTADSGDRHQTLRMRTLVGDLLQFLFDRFQLFRQSIQLSQLRIQCA